MVTLYLIRHCEARGNIDREFQGRFDSDISENGRRQLDALANRFRDIPLEGIYSSPLRRARLTAEAVNRFHQLPIVFDDRLKEIDGGQWEQKPWAKLPELFPECSERWAKTPHTFEAPGGESMQTVYRRMKDALLDIAGANEGKTVAVASHGCAIRNALCWALTGDPEKLAEIPWCDNTAVSLLTFLDGKVHVEYYNDNSHLDKSISTLEKQSWWRKDSPSAFE